MALAGAGCQYGVNLELTSATEVRKKIQKRNDCGDF